jgi:hypothetical protein
MTFLRRLAAGALAVAMIGLTLTAMLFLNGCRKKAEVILDTNLAPDTRLTSAPGPYSQANYRVHMYWQGSDPDGYVVAYYYAWDDTIASAWTYTTRSDSLFKALIDTAGETRRHTFYVRAVDNEGKLDPSPARIRFDAWTVVPVIDYLYRLDGPDDPNGPNYQPGRNDTVLMTTPCSFVWSGRDPDGLGAPVQFSYRLDSNSFGPFVDETAATQENVSNGTHFFQVKGEDETGAESFPTSYKFVMNFDPDSEITAPADSSGTLTVRDGDRIIFHWMVRDKEEIEGVGGGVNQVIIYLDSGFQWIFNKDTPEYQEFWMFTSDTVNQQSPHYMPSKNIHIGGGGGNRQHEFRLKARDVEGRYETISSNPADRERYFFRYNFPPSTVVTYPAEGETLCPDFTVEWSGEDADGTVMQYQYVLDPAVSSYKMTDETSRTYTGIEPGPHELRVAAIDNSDCWQLGYTIVRFYVRECK